jgi:hypothetical protein
MLTFMLATISVGGAGSIFFSLPKIAILYFNTKFDMYRKSNLCIPGKGIAWPQSYIHVSVSDLYITRIGPDIWMQQNRQTNPGNI